MWLSVEIFDKRHTGGVSTNIEKRHRIKILMTQPNTSLLWDWLQMPAPPCRKWCVIKILIVINCWVTTLFNKSRVPVSFAAIDWSFYAALKTTCRYTRKYNKRTKTRTVKTLRETKGYEYIPVFSEKIFELRKEIRIIVAWQDMFLWMRQIQKKNAKHQKHTCSKNEEQIWNKCISLHDCTKFHFNVL